ncbi:hypothetical protein BSLA_01r3399 [Burkholderia stabilis]|nr:hypothetical protein BSLA_01r3399 [Burkholderia stabilis]
MRWPEFGAPFAEVLVARGSAIADITCPVAVEQCSQPMRHADLRATDRHEADDVQPAIRVCRLCNEDACDLRRGPSEHACRRLPSERETGG